MTPDEQNIAISYYLDENENEKESEEEINIEDLMAQFENTELNDE